jgi:hypothetical protein
MSGASNGIAARTSAVVVGGSLGGLGIVRSLAPVLFAIWLFLPGSSPLPAWFVDPLKDAHTRHPDVGMLFRGLEVSFEPPSPKHGRWPTGR